VTDEIIPPAKKSRGAAAREVIEQQDILPPDPLVRTGAALARFTSTSPSTFDKDFRAQQSPKQLRRRAFAVLNEHTPEMAQRAVDIALGRIGTDERVAAVMLQACLDRTTGKAQDSPNTGDAESDQSSRIPVKFLSSAQQDRLGEILTELGELRMIALAAEAASVGQ
jgi:hypothetical protein